MTKKTLRSRILENFEPNLMKELYKVCKSSVVSDNNIKADTMLNILRQYGKDFVELGPGTNRLAILIDNYVIKLALDKWGIQDNWNEFTMTQELQPYVIKVYECNGFLAVTEYVTVISREEFMEKKEELKKILAILAEGYLLGDVGTVQRNFLNWGYRDNGDIVILDFAYIYRVKGDELLCSNCGEIIQYDDNFHNLICPKCARKFTFTDIRRKIPMEDEQRENFMAKELAYKLTKPLQELEEHDESDREEESSLYRNISTDKEDNKMKYDEKCKPVDDEENLEQSYYDTLDFFSNMKKTSSVCEKPAPQNNDVEIALEENRIHLAHDPQKIIEDTEVFVDEDNVTPTETVKESEVTKECDHKVIVDTTVKVTEVDNGSVVKETEKQSTIVNTIKEEQQVVTQTVVNNNNSEPKCDPNIKFPEVPNKSSSIKVFLSGADENDENENCKDGFSSVPTTPFEVDVRLEKKDDESPINVVDTLIEGEHGAPYTISSSIEMPAPAGDHIDSFTEKDRDPIEALRDELRMDAGGTEEFLDADEQYDRLYDQNDKEKRNSRGGNNRRRWDD